MFYTYKDGELLIKHWDESGFYNNAYEYLSNNKKSSVVSQSDNDKSEISIYSRICNEDNSLTVVMGYDTVDMVIDFYFLENRHEVRKDNEIYDLINNLCINFECDPETVAFVISTLADRLVYRKGSIKLI